MIKIIAKNYSPAVDTICSKLDKEMAQYDVCLSQNAKTLNAQLVSAVEENALILIGDTCKWCTTFAETFGLALVYDKFAEKSIREFCKLSGTTVPAQYALDNYCTLPETFIHYASVFCLQCGCGGEYAKCHVYILPADSKECDLLFENYLAKDLFKVRNTLQTYCYKLFGLSQSDLQSKLEKLNIKFVSVKTETNNLDSKVTLTFPKSCAKKIITETLELFAKTFESFIYATGDVTLPQKVIALLSERYKTLATAESITGGLISSSLVEVAGASDVLIEGAVTYSIEAKCRRLGLNPHFIDEHGVVSSQVAREMAVSQLQNADFAVATTGYAGPTADGNNPVGLCFIAVAAKDATKSYVKVFKNLFHGDRNSIRQQVANTAMFLLTNAVTNPQFFAVKK